MARNNKILKILHIVMKFILFSASMILNLLCLTIVLSAEEEKKVISSSYVSFCIISLQKEVNWLLVNIDEKKLTRDSEKVIIERMKNSLSQIKKIVTNPSCKSITFTDVKNGLLQDEAILRFEGQIENASGALLGFADELDNDSTVKDKIKAMNIRLDAAHATLLDASK